MAGNAMEWVADWWSSSYRHFEDPPTYSDHHIGFRIVATD